MSPTLLTIAPNELEFELRLGKTLSQQLTLTNNASQKVAFKVKTTAPKRYCVKPNAGTLGPNDSVHVDVLLQPLKELPDSCKDKFQVLSIVHKDGESTEDIKAYWDMVASTREADIVPTKLKCSFKPADNIKAQTSSPEPESGLFVTAPNAASARDDDWKKKYAELESRHKEEAKEAQAKIDQVKQDRNNLVVQLTDVQKALEELKKKTGAAPAKASASNSVEVVSGGPNLMLLGLVGLICAILGHLLGAMLL